MPKKTGGLEEAMSGTPQPEPPAVPQQAPNVPPPTTALQKSSTSTSITTEKLDVIIGFLYRMDKRDRMRTWGGLVRSAISILPMLLVLWSALYFYMHGNELIQKISDQAVKSAAAYNQQSLMDQLTKALNQKKK